MLESCPYQLIDILLQPNTVEEINNQEDQDIEIETISDNHEEGWRPKRKSDFIDLRLAYAVKIYAIEVIKTSNVRSFKVILIDKNEVSREFKIKNKKNNKNPNLVLSLIHSNNLNGEVSDKDLIRVLRFKPTDKLDKKKPYNIKIKIFVCSGK